MITGNRKDDSDQTPPGLRVPKMFSHKLFCFQAIDRTSQRLYSLGIHDDAQTKKSKVKISGTVFDF